MLFQTTITFYLTALPLAWALQATPDSACASSCIDSPSQNASDFTSFNTFDADLTCSDSSYSSTDAGRKFKKCNTCLQNSTAESAGISDQGALMYNLRATIDYCLWGFPNASTEVSSPCSTDYACEPLKTALAYGSLNPSNETEWGYCTADNGAFLGQNLSPCIQCFQATTDETYIANFLIALQAGCQQKPRPGQAIGLEGTIFSQTAVNITSIAGVVPVSTQPKGMPTGTIIGIAIGGTIVFVAIISIFVVIFRKRRAALKRGMAALKSDYDTRYGAQDITCPTMGGFAAPPSPREKEGLPEYERRAQQVYGGGSWSEDEERTASQRSLHTQTWHAQPFHEGAIPTHPAYRSKDQIRTPPRDTFEPARPLTRNTMKRDGSGIGFTRTTIYATPSSGSGSRNGTPSPSPPPPPPPPVPSTKPASPGLPPTTPKSLFSRLAGKRGKMHNPPITPRTPNDIWN